MPETWGASSDHGLASPPVLVEGGHYTLAVGPQSEEQGEPIVLPDDRCCTALTTPTTRRCFEAAVAEVRLFREQGIPATVGLLVGDLALPAESRPPGGPWALPMSYLEILKAARVAPEEVRVYGEAYARNQGKRRLLDLAFARRIPPEKSYRDQGWAFFRSDGVDQLCMASDASLDWEGEVRAAMLLRGRTPLCPLVFAGLKRAIFQAGFRTHWAFYAVADDHIIDRKLCAAAATITQLRAGRVGLQMDSLFLSSVEAPALKRSWHVDELVAPGERTWPEFVDAVRAYHPQFLPVTQ